MRVCEALTLTLWRALVLPVFGTFLTLLALLTATSASAATLPAGFTERGVATGLASPTAMEFAPDGRLFVAEQGGRLRVIKNGALLPTPFVTLTVDSTGERGLLGVAFDPDFATNHFVYVYYTATSAGRRTTASAASPPTATSPSPAARSILLDLDNLSTATNHNGGAHALRPRRQALRRRRRERERRQRRSR